MGGTGGGSRGYISVAYVGKPGVLLAERGVLLLQVGVLGGLFWGRQVVGFLGTNRVFFCTFQGVSWYNLGFFWYVKGVFGTQRGQFQEQSGVGGGVWFSPPLS